MARLTVPGTQPAKGMLVDSHGVLHRWAAKFLSWLDGQPDAVDLAAAIRDADYVAALDAGLPDWLRRWRQATP